MSQQYEEAHEPQGAQDPPTLGPKAYRRIEEFDSQRGQQAPQRQPLQVVFDPAREGQVRKTVPVLQPEAAQEIEREPREFVDDSENAQVDQHGDPRARAAMQRERAQSDRPPGKEQSKQQGKIDKETRDTQDAARTVVALDARGVFHNFAPEGAVCGGPTRREDGSAPPPWHAPP